MKITRKVTVFLMLAVGCVAGCSASQRQMEVKDATLALNAMDYACMFANADLGDAPVVADVCGIAKELIPMVEKALNGLLLANSDAGVALRRPHK